MRVVGIDPATTTGFVALNAEGSVLVEEDLRGTRKTVLEAYLRSNWQTSDIAYTTTYSRTMLQ